MAIGIVAAPLAATPPPVAHTADWAVTDNLQAIGFSPRQVEFPGPAAGRINSDLAFWGKMAVQGTYEGFRLIDVSLASRPKEILNYEECAPDSTAGNQGDVTSTATSSCAPGTRTRLRGARSRVTANWSPAASRACTSSTSPTTWTRTSLPPST